MDFADWRFVTVNGRLTLKRISEDGTPGPPPGPVTPGGGEGETVTIDERLRRMDFRFLTTVFDVTTNDVVKTGTVKWPDGSGGTYTATQVNATWHDADAFVVTHLDSGKKVTQNQVTRNSSGYVTNQPDLIITNI